MTSAERLKLLVAHAQELEAHLAEHGVVHSKDGRFYTHPALNALVNLSREIRQLEKDVADESPQEAVTFFDRLPKVDLGPCPSPGCSVGANGGLCGHRSARAS